MIIEAGDQSPAFALVVVQFKSKIAQEVLPSPSEREDAEGRCLPRGGENSRGDSKDFCTQHPIMKHTPS